MSLGSVIVRLTMDTATFDTDAGRAAKIAEKRAKEIDASFKRAGAAIGVALAGAAIGITAALKSSINSMDEMSKSAQKVGISTEEFSKLTYAASLADVSMETLVGSLGKLTKSQAAALKGTGDQAKVFEALGISIKNADGSLRDSSDVLGDFADRFRDLKGSPEAMAAGFSLFGRSFQELIPLLKDGGDGIRDAGAELEALGGVLSTEAGQNAEAFNDNLTRLETAARSLAMQVASDLLPDLVSLSENFLGASTNGDKMKETASSLADSIRVLAQAAGLVATAFKLVGEGIGAAMAQGHAFMLFAKGDVREAMNLYREAGAGFSAEVAQAFSDRPVTRVGTSPQGARKGTRGGTTAGLERSQAQIDADTAAYTRKLQEALGGAGGTTKPKGGGGKSEAQREAEQLDASYQRLKDSLNETYALFDQNTEAAKILYDTQNGELAKLSEARKQELVLLAERNDAQKLAKELQDAADKAAEGESKRVREAIKDNEDVLAFMRDDYELMKMSNKEREREFALRQLNKDATDEQIEAVKLQADANYELAESLAFADDVKAGLSDMFVDFISGAKSAKEAFGDFADQLFKRALQFVADKAIQAMFDAFDGDGKIGGKDSSGGGMWANILGAFAGAFGGGKASGGTARANTMYEVNERGFEMATVGGRDYMLTGNNPVQITPNHRLGRGGGAAVTNNFIVGPQNNQRTQEQIANRTAYELQQAQRRNS